MPQSRCRAARQRSGETVNSPTVQVVDNRLVTEVRDIARVVGVEHAASRLEPGQRF